MWGSIICAGGMVHRNKQCIFFETDIGWIEKALPGTSMHLSGPALMSAYPLEQIEFLGAANGCPAVVHPQLVKNVIGVGAQCVERHNELLGNFWAA